MKKIFVTVAEFLENGGKLEIGRAIYHPQGSYIGMMSEQWITKPMIVIDCDDYSNDNVSVKIDCQPIYV